MADLVIPRVDFSPLGDIGTSFYQGQQMALENQRRQALANLPRDASGNIDYNKAAAMVAPYDLQSAATLANLGNAQQVRAQAANQFALEQYKTSPEYLGKVKAAERTGEVVTINPGGGLPSYSAVRQADGSLTPISGGTAQAANPYYQPGREGQTATAGYTDRLVNADKALQVGPPNLEQRIGAAAKSALGVVPFVGKPAAGLIPSEHAAAYQNASDDFINANLKRAPGTPVKSDERKSASEQFIPSPYDSPADLARKKANRDAAIAEMGRSAGPTYQPPGTAPPQGAPQGQPQGQPPTQTAQVMPLKTDAQKNAAIAEFRTAAARFIAAGQPVPQAMFAKAQALGIPASALRYGPQ